MLIECRDILIIELQNRSYTWKSKVYHLSNRSIPAYSKFAGASVRNSQAKGTYFRKVIRSPRPTTFAKNRICGKTKNNEYNIARYANRVSSKESSRIGNDGTTGKKIINRLLIFIVSQLTSLTKNFNNEDSNSKLEIDEYTTNPNITLDISQNYYGLSNNNKNTAAQRRSKHPSGERETFNKRIMSLEATGKGDEHLKLVPNHKQASILNERNKSNLPQVKLSNAKLNIYKYHKSYYRFGKIERLFLGSKLSKNTNL